MSNQTEPLTPEQLEALKVFAKEVDCLAETVLLIALESVPKILPGLPSWDTGGAREVVNTIKGLSNELENLINHRATLNKCGFVLFFSDR